MTVQLNCCLFKNSSLSYLLRWSTVLFVQKHAWVECIMFELCAYAALSGFISFLCAVAYKGCFVCGFDITFGDAFCCVHGTVKAVLVK